MRVAVQHEAVFALSARLALIQRAIEDELDALDCEAARLSTSWDGASQNAYTRAHREWSGSMHRMKALLDEMNRVLNRVNAISIETSAKATELWS